ncbi:ZKSC3 protein, partial [Vidua macroura]|nr:ZKSC3 protein [Vidua macroura]
PYECSECGKKAWSSLDLLKRQRTHTQGRGPSAALTCRKGFTRNFSLLTHLCIHTQETPLECPCFSRSYHLTRHQ